MQFLKKTTWVNILLFLIPTTIWSTSFLLIKESLKGLSVPEVGSIRIISAGIILLPLAWKYRKQVTRKDLLLLFISGTIGALIPAYCTALGEVHLSQTEAGIFNSLTPLFTIVLGAFVFRITTKPNQWIGVITGLVGAWYLIWALQKNVSAVNINLYSAFAILNTCLYAINLHFITKRLMHLPFMVIVTFTFTTIIPPALLILFMASYTDIWIPISISWAMTEAVLLGVFCSTIANIALYKLIKNTGSLITSYTSYVTPIFALLIGIFYGDTITIHHIIALLLILIGVTFVQKK